MPTAKQKNKKAKLPSLEHRYKYRMKRLSTAEGIALEALGGNKTSIKRLADVGAYLMHDLWTARDGDNAVFALWLAEILGDIANGKEPNEAFGWSNKEGRWKIHNGETAEHVMKSFQVARTIEAFAINITGMSYEDAIEHAAEVWRVTSDQCRDATKETYMGLKKPRIGIVAAKELALDMVSEFGASGHAPMPRATAAGYYKELIKTRGNEKKPFPI